MSKSKRSSDWMEKRRHRAIELSLRGWTQIEIADALGVTKGAVSQWIKRFSEGGRKSLKAIPRPGAPARLTEEQRKKLPELLDCGAEVYGFHGDLWTSSRISRVIRSEFGVNYHKHHVARIMKDLGWSSHKPVVRAAQRDEEEITRWRSETWPSLKKSPKRA